MANIRTRYTAVEMSLLGGRESTVHSDTAALWKHEKTVGATGNEQRNKSYAGDGSGA